MMKSRISVVLASATIAVTLSLNAHAAKPTSKVVAEGLDNPTGVAIQPGSGHVFIASHAGIFRLDPKSGKVTPEVTGYPDPTDIYGKGPKYPIGPLGVCFMDPNHLVVGDGSRKDGEELVRVYKVGNEAPKKPQAEGDAAFTLGPIPPSDQSIKGEGNFYGVASNGEWIYVTCNGDDTKGWVARSKIKDGKPGKLQLKIATKEAVEVDAPAPIIFNKSGKGIVVGQKGEVNQPGDSLITFYSQNGKLGRNFESGLNDVVGLAYKPGGPLFATDFSWIDASKGGLFRINLKKGNEKAIRVLDLDKPTGIAFDDAGNAYIAVFGTQAEGSDKPAGKIVKVSGL